MRRVTKKFPSLKRRTVPAKQTNGTPRMASIVPPRSIAGRALVAVLAIMCFLACLAVAAVTMVVETASDWQSGVAREVTIQIRPLDGINLEGEINKAVALAKATKGITGVSVLSKKENERLLEPWLGPGIGLENLPIPRLLLLSVDSSAKPDMEALRTRLVAEIKGATLDDHRQWQNRLALMTGSIVAIGVIILVLVLVAATLSVIFSTRAAMAANRDIVDVLNLVGAEDRFIASAFQRRFMQLGLEGGFYGGVAALIAFPATGLFVQFFFGSTGKAQIDTLVGGTALSLSAMLAILVTVLAMALMTAFTSRLTVRHYLKSHN